MSNNEVIEITIYKLKKLKEELLELQKNLVVKSDCKKLCKELSNIKD